MSTPSFAKLPHAERLSPLFLHALEELIRVHVAEVGHGWPVSRFEGTPRSPVCAAEVASVLSSHVVTGTPHSPLHGPSGFHAVTSSRGPRIVTTPRLPCTQEARECIEPSDLPMRDSNGVLQMHNDSRVSVTWSSDLHKTTSASNASDDASKMASNDTSCGSQKKVSVQIGVPEYFESPKSTTSLSFRTASCNEFCLHAVWRADPANAEGIDANLQNSDTSKALDALDEQEFKAMKVMRSPFVVSPEAPLRVLWEVLGTILVLYDVVSLPLQAFQLDSTSWTKTIELIILWYFTFDLPASFFVGYIDGTGELVMRTDRIAIHYLTSWFTLDFLVILCDWIIFLLSVFGDEDADIDAFGMLRAAKVPRVFRVVRALRFVRLRKLSVVTQVINENVDSEHLALFVHVSAYITVILLLNHVIACSWYWLGIEQGSKGWVQAYHFAEDTKSFQYWTCLHWSMTQLTPGSMDLQPKNTLERVASVFVLLFSLVVFSTFVSSITSGMNRIFNAKKQQRTQLWALRRFLRQHHIPHELTFRIHRYVALIFQSQRGFIQRKDVELLHLLSRPLHIELVTALYNRFLVVHPFFELLERKDRPVMRKICDTAIQSMHLGKGDSLFSIGGRCEHMYFLTTGILLYDPKKVGYVAVPCCTGLWCCEAVLWTKWIHRGSMRAKVECEVICLSAQMFQDIVAHEAIDPQLPRKYGHAFVQALTVSVLEAEGTLSDLQADLMDDIAIRAVVKPLSQLSTLAARGRIKLARGTLKHVHSFLGTR